MKPERRSRHGKPIPPRIRFESKANEVMLMSAALATVYKKYRQRLLDRIEDCIAARGDAKELLER